MVSLLSLFLTVSAAGASDFLAVAGSELTLRGNPVFLSGANLPWINYGQDFGDGQSNGIACELQSFVTNVSKSGGNSIRLWLFVEGDSIPVFDDVTGDVTSTDRNNTLIKDVDTLAAFAASQDVLINICLWNGALMRNQNVVDMVTNASKTQSFIDNALRPLVEALASRNGIGSWEILNEPEGSVLIDADDEPCFDTSNLAGTGAGWAGTGVRMQDLLRFINQCGAAIKAADPKALVNVGAWSEWTIYDIDNDVADDSSATPRDYYSDACLKKAGGHELGTMDFVQVHSYAWEGKYSESSPFSIPKSDFGVTKPILIGEFASVDCAQGFLGGPELDDCSVQQHYEWALTSGYAGIWDWALIGGESVDNATLCNTGMAAIADESLVQAVALDGEAPEATCGCSDLAPDDEYSCAEQADWGKCSDVFMAGFCCLSCHACSGCT